MNKVIEAIKAETLRGIWASRPQKNSEGHYVCRFCGSTGDRGWSQWHSCDEKTKQGIDVRFVR